jgi:hypothetical protein
VQTYRASTYPVNTYLHDVALGRRLRILVLPGLLPVGVGVQVGVIEDALLKDHLAVVLVNPMPWESHLITPVDYSFAGAIARA